MDVFLFFFTMQPLFTMSCCCRAAISLNGVIFYSLSPSTTMRLSRIGIHPAGVPSFLFQSTMKTKRSLYLRPLSSSWVWRSTLTICLFLFSCFTTTVNPCRKTRQRRHQDAENYAESPPATICTIHLSTFLGGQNTWNLSGFVPKTGLRS